EPTPQLTPKQPARPTPERTPAPATPTPTPAREHSPSPPAQEISTAVPPQTATLAWKQTPTRTSEQHARQPDAQSATTPIPGPPDDSLRSLTTPPLGLYRSRRNSGRTNRCGVRHCVSSGR